MPTYQYHCQKCDHELDHFQKITDAPLQECPKCHKDGLRRGPGGGIGLSFKGSGFYITDYGPKSGSEGNSEGPKNEAKPCSGGCSCH